jgi:hypothetical protein
MNTNVAERLSDSPHVERIGWFRADEAYAQSCRANHLWNMLLVKHMGKVSLSVWGPMTQFGMMNYPEGAEFLYIAFKLGSFMPRFPVGNLADTGIILPDATSQSFWLDSSAWQYPSYENADTFVDRLVRDGLLMHEPIVDAVLHNHPPELPSRTIRHRFLRATGVTHSYIRQLERAQQAADLLAHGTAILDTVAQAGYADQPHLTRSLKRFIGQTPAQIARLS